MILMYCYVLAALLLILLARNSIRQKKRRAQARWVSLWLRQLRDLLELFPKHRGMANAFLKGDTTFRAKMEKLQDETDEKIQSMRQLVVVRDERSEQQLLGPIVQKWRSIKQNVYTMPADRCFYAHSQLIALVIERLQDDALELLEYSYRSDSRDQGKITSIISMLTSELPQVVESMGQARGIGTGVAAQQSSSVANRVNLKYLHSRAFSIINNKLAPLHATVNEQQGLGQNIRENYINNAVEASRRFLDLLKKELIDTAHPTVAPEKYYQQGTAAIEAELQLFDQLFPRCIQILGLK